MLSFDPFELDFQSEKLVFLHPKQLFRISFFLESLFQLLLAGIQMALKVLDFVSKGIQTRKIRLLLKLQRLQFFNIIFLTSFIRLDHELFLILAAVMLHFSLQSQLVDSLLVLKFVVEQFFDLLHTVFHHYLKLLFLQLKYLYLLSRAESFIIFRRTDYLGLRMRRRHRGSLAALWSCIVSRDLSYLFILKLEILQLLNLLILEFPKARLDTLIIELFLEVFMV